MYIIVCLIISVLMNACNNQIIQPHCSHNPVKNLKVDKFLDADKTLVYTISWEKPDDNGSLPIISYYVYTQNPQQPEIWKFHDIVIPSEEDNLFTTTIPANKSKCLSVLVGVESEGLIIYPTGSAESVQGTNPIKIGYNCT
jgi:hypothetical protein